MSTSYKTALMHKKGAEYEKLIDIKAFPNLGGAPEMLQSTTLSDSAHTYELGIQSQDALEFPVNYKLEDYHKLKAMEGKELDFAIWFGGERVGGEFEPDGSGGKYAFKGALTVFVTGKGVNEIMEMTISIAPSTPIEEVTETP